MLHQQCFFAFRLSEQVVCRACSRNRYPLKYLKDRVAKVCDHCYAELRKRGEFHLSELAHRNRHILRTSCPVLVLTDCSHRWQCVGGVQQLQPTDSPCQPSSLGRLPEPATAEFVEEQEEQLPSQPGEPRLHLCTFQNQENLKRAILQACQ